MSVLRTGLSLRTLSLAAGILAGLSLAGCNRAVDVTAKPGEQADQQLAESQPAAILVAAPIDLGHTNDEVNKLLPVEIAQIGRRIAHAQCSTVKGQQVCLDVRLSGRIVRDGQAHFIGTARGLDLQVPFRYELVAQPFGAGSNTTLNGKLTATASYTLSLDEHWQPALKQEPGYKWDDGGKIKVLAGDTTVQADVEPVLSQHLSKLPPAAVGGLVPAELKHQVEVVWRFLHYPVALSQEQQIWLRGTPLGLRYGGISSVDGVTELRMAVTARMQTFVGERPAPLPPSPLASPGSGPEAMGGGVLLPAEIAYETLAASVEPHLPAIPPREVAGEKSAPPAQVKALGFFASGRRLGVAVHFGALPGGSWFSGHAAAYFLATPAIKPGSSILTLSQTELYAPNLKPSSALKEMPFLADSRFADNIGASLSIDVADKLAAATDLVQRHANVSLTQGLMLTMAPASARVAKISPGIDALHLQIEVDGQLLVRREGTDVAIDSGSGAKVTP